MAFNKTLIILIISLSCLILNTNAAAVNRTRAPSARVWSICKPTTNPLLCYKTILPQVPTGRFNIYKALEIEILATQKQVQITSASIDKLLAKPGNSKDMADSLRICQDQYKNILDAIDESIKQVSRRYVVEARFKFSAVFSYYSSCNDEFIKGTSPIATDERGVYDLGGNWLDIMKVIEDRETRKREGKPAPPTSPSPANPCKDVIGFCLFH